MEMLSVERPGCPSSPRRQGLKLPRFRDFRPQRDLLPPSLKAFDISRLESFHTRYQAIRVGDMPHNRLVSSHHGHAHLAGKPSTRPAMGAGHASKRQNLNG